MENWSSGWNKREVVCDGSNRKDEGLQVIKVEAPGQWEVEAWVCSGPSLCFLKQNMKALSQEKSNLLQSKSSNAQLVTDRDIIKGQ